MRAEPLASIQGSQGRLGRLGRLVQHLEQRLDGACRTALALLPVTDGFQRDMDTLGKLRLAQPQALAHPTRESGRITHGLDLIGGLL